jgi:hypothetical protein
MGKPVPLLAMNCCVQLRPFSGSESQLTGQNIRHLVEWVNQIHTAHWCVLCGGECTSIPVLLRMLV